MTFAQTTLWTRTALPLLLAAVIAGPSMSQDVPAGSTPLTASEIAPALTRTDSIPGAYEVLHWAEEGLVFVASTPAFTEGTAGFVHVLRAEDLSPVRRIQLPRRPFALALDRSTGRLYAGNTLDGSLTVLDAKGGQILDVIQLGLKDEEGGYEHTRMVRLDEEKGLAFVTSPGRKGVIWIVDIKEGKLLHRIESGLWTAGGAYDALAGRFYGSGGGIEEISVVDAASGARTGAIVTGDTTDADPDASKHFFVNLDIDREGQRLFAADANTGSLYVFDIESGKVIATTPVGPGTLDVAYNAVRQQIYLTYRGVTREESTGTGGVVVIDAKDYTVTRNLPLPVHPNSLNVSEDGETLFVTVKAPHSDKHPAYREGAEDSVVSIKLDALP